jgi:addiction module HigA family antidote
MATPALLKSSITIEGAAMKAIHPGEFLAEILEETGLAQAELARRIGVSPMRVSHLVNGARPVTAELALLFGREFGQTAEYWMNLQARFDLDRARRAWSGDRGELPRCSPMPDP